MTRRLLEKGILLTAAGFRSRLSALRGNRFSRARSNHQYYGLSHPVPFIMPRITRDTINFMLSTLWLALIALAWSGAAADDAGGVSPRDAFASQRACLWSLAPTCVKGGTYESCWFVSSSGLRPPRAVGRATSLLSVLTRRHPSTSFASHLFCNMQSRRDNSLPTIFLLCYFQTQSAGSPPTSAVAQGETCSPRRSLYAKP